MGEEDRHDELLRRYLEDIAGEPLLSADEETRLGRAARDGDLAAEQTLIRANLKLVVALARRYGASGVPMLDLVQEGNLGLMQSVEAYDPDKGFAFRTFAMWWIRQAINRGIVENGGSVTRAGAAVGFDVQLQDVWDHFVAHHGRQPTIAELASDLGVSESRIVEALGQPPLDP